MALSYVIAGVQIMHNVINNLMKRRLVTYLQAVDNEISIDLSIFDLYCVKPENVGYIPRPAKWLNFAVQRQKLMYFFWFLLASVWRLGGGAVFYFMQLFYYYIYSKYRGCKIKQALSFNEYVLAFSSRVADIVKPGSVNNIPKCWITFPWAPLAEIPIGSSQFDIFSLIEGRDLLEAYLQSVAAINVLSFRKNTSKWVLQSYTAFRWFAVRAAIEKIEGIFLIAEHYDRWAVLADSVISRKKYAPNSNVSRISELHLVQHGSLAGLNLQEPVPHLPFKLKRRLKSVTQLYVFDDMSRRIFINDIISAEPISSKIKVNYFSHKIFLQNGSDTAGFKILFVGHPLCEEFHTYLHNLLSQKYNIYFYYKPHPTASASSNIKDIGWTFIENRIFFPDVNMIISYPSTLVDEYASHGIPALVHPINMKKENSDNFTDEMISNINSMIFN